MPIYLRREPAREPYLREPGKPLNPMCRNVVAYEDAEATKLRMTWHWTRADKPDKRRKYLALPEGKKYIVWLPDLPMD